MSKVNTLFVASIKSYNGSTDNPAKPDKNGIMPVILDVVAGSCPNKRVVSGTVAERADLTKGKTYLVKAEEIDTDPDNGRQFRFTAVKELSFSELLEATQHFGVAKVINVTQAVTTETTQEFSE